MFKKKMKRIATLSLAAVCATTGLNYEINDVNVSKAAVEKYTGGTTHTADLPTDYLDLPVVEGTCSDGTTMYYMKTSKDNSAYQGLYKIDATNRNAKPQLLSYFSCLSHANDLTYCSKDGFIYIAPGAGNSHQGVYLINPNNTSQFYYGAKLYYDVAAISYNPSNDRFYVREKNSNDLNNATIHVYNYNWQELVNEKMIITKRYGEKWQGLETRGDYLYTITSGQKTRTNESFIYTYSISSKTKASRTDFIKKNQDYFEIEGLTFIKGQPYASVNYTSNNDRVVRITSGLPYYY